MKKIIALGSSKRVGKDLAAMLIYQELKIQYPNLRVTVAAFADKLYEICNILYGTGDKKYYEKHPEKKEEMLPIGLTFRNTLIKLGNTIVENVYEHTWIDPVLNIDCDVLVITDVRYMRELKALRNYAEPENLRLIKIIRGDCTDDLLTCPDYWDYIIENNGTKRALNDELVSVLKEFIHD